MSRSVDVINVRKLHTEQLPDGKYTGVRNKDRVAVNIAGQDYELQTKLGVMQKDVICDVIVSFQGKVTVCDAGTFDVD